MSIFENTAVTELEPQEMANKAEKKHQFIHPVKIAGHTFVEFIAANNLQSVRRKRTFLGGYEEHTFNFSDREPLVIRRFVNDLPFIRMYTKAIPNAAGPFLEVRKGIFGLFKRETSIYLNTKSISGFYAPFLSSMRKTVLELGTAPHATEDYSGKPKERIQVRGPLEVIKPIIENTLK